MAVHPLDRDLSLRQWQQAVQQCSPLNGEYRLLRPDGSWQWTNVRATPILNSDGSIRKWLGVNINITDRKLAEERLRQSQERLQRALSIRTVGVLYFDLEGHIHNANEAFERMSGYGHQALVSGQVSWDQLIPEEFMAHSRNARDEYRTKGENTPYERQQELHLYRIV